MIYTDTTPQIKWDQEKRILYIDFVGHITKNEIIAAIKQIEDVHEIVLVKQSTVLHNFKKTTHVTLEAQVLYSEQLQKRAFKKHAFVSVNSMINETIDIIISIAEQNENTMQIFGDENSAIECLLS